MDIIVTATGQVHCIYDETIALTTLGKLTVQRGSHAITRGVKYPG